MLPRFAAVPESVVAATVRDTIAGTVTNNVKYRKWPMDVLQALCGSNDG